MKTSPSPAFSSRPRGKSISSILTGRIASGWSGAALLAVPLLWAQQARAATYNWIDVTTTTPLSWATNSLWNTPPPIAGTGLAGDIYTFSATQTVAKTINLDGDRKLGNLVFGQTSAFAYNLSSTAGGSLIFDNGVGTAAIDFIGTAAVGNVIGAPIILNSNLEISMAQIATHTISGIISGNKSIAIDTNGTNAGQTINGQGDLILRGMNTYTGGTTITEARVQAHGFSFGTGAITINNFGAVILNSGGYIKNNLNLTGLGWKETSGSIGALRPEGNSVFTGVITPVSSGAATIARISVSVASNALFNGTFAGSGDLEFATAAAITGNYVLNNTAAQTHTGNYLVDRAISTGTTVLQIGNNNTNGSILGTNNVTVSTGGVLQFNRTDNVTFANPILVGAGSGGVTQAGLGTVTLTNAGLGYTGTTTVNSLNGKLIVGTGGAVTVGTTAVVLSNYGDLEFNTSSAIGLTGASTGGRDAYITQNGTGTLTLSGAADNVGARDRRAHV